jgi:hypothetical protein
MMNKTGISSNGPALISGLAVILLLGVAVPAAAQYSIFDLGVTVTTQDIQADSQNTVHLIWTSKGVLYYGNIVDNAITGKVQVATGVNTVYWRPFLSVQPGGSSVHIAWTTGGMGNKLMHSWKTTGAWKTETVMTVPGTQWLTQPTCAIDSKGVLHTMFVIWNKTANWSTIFYRRKLASGKWETKKQFTPLQPEYKFPLLCVDTDGRVHFTWTCMGRSGTDRYDAYYCTAPSGGLLTYASRVKLPKSADCSLNGYGDLYVDRNGVVHRSIGAWSNALQKMAIDHTKKPVGGSFQTPTRPSIVFLNVKQGDPVPAVVAGEDGKVVVAWGQIGTDGSNTVQASFYDPGTRAWSIYTIDPAAGIPTQPNAYCVAMTRSDTEMLGLWRGSNGNLKLFVVPIQ